MRHPIFSPRLFPVTFLSLGLALFWTPAGGAALAWGQSSNTAETLAARIGAINREVRETAPLSGTSRRLAGLLQERAALLSELIGKDPARALEAALPSAVTDGLRIEQPGSPLETGGQWEGTVEAAISDDFTTARSETRWYLNTGRERVEMFFTGEWPRRKGIHLSVEGMRLGNRLAIVGSREVAPGMAAQGAAASGTALSCTTVGPQNIAVLMLTMPSNQSFPPAYTKAALQDAFFGSPADTSDTQSLNGYWKEMSYGKTSAVGQVFGPFALTQDYTLDTQGDLETEAINLADSTVDFTQFTRIALVFPIAYWGGWAADDSIGCWTISSPSKGNLNASIGWLPAFPNSSPPVGTYAHELGHGLGLHHSSSDDYGAVPIGPMDQAGTLTEYGDPFSTMGGGGGHYVGEHKSLILHWLNLGDYLEVTSSGSFTLEPLESTANPRSLRVLRDAVSSAWLWLEYRQPIGDVDTQLGSYLGDLPFDGALVHYEDPNLDSPEHTYLLDFKPVSAPNYFFQSALTPGSSWSDPYSLLTLRVGNPAYGGLPVSVSYDQPCASLQYSATAFPAAGGSGTITVSAPANCTWSASTASSWISFPNATSGSGHGTVPFSVAANSGADQQNGYITVQRQSTRIIERGTKSVLSVSPSFGTGATGQFTFAFDDVNGYQDISSLSVNFSGSPSCYVYVYPSSGQLYLSGDPGGSSPPPVTIGTPGSTASNSSCSISSSGGSIAGSGNQLLFTVEVNFFASFAGAHRIEAEAGGSPTVPLGTWIVPSVQQAGVTIQASAAGAPFSLDDGSVYTAPATFFWPAGSQHTVAWLSTWAGQAGKRYAFQDWTDGGSNPRTITAPSGAASYTANIAAQYRLSVAVTPAGAGQLSAAPFSSDGYYDSGASVQIQATPNPGYSFQSFGGDALGDGNPATVTVTMPLSVTGYFYCALAVSSGPPETTGSDSTSGLVDLSIGAGCAWTAASDSAWLTVSPASGTGSSTLPYAIAANPGAARTGTVTLTYNGDWTAPYTVNQDAAGSPRASVKSLSPVWGAGLSTVATAQFSAAGGYGQLAYAMVSYQSTDSDSYCEAELYRDSSGGDWIYLSDDLGGRLYSPVPGSGTLSVSRCSLDLSSLAVSGSGNDLTLALPLHFATAFAGNKLVMVEASTFDSNGWTSGQLMGTWVVATPNGAGSLRFVPVTPCRVADTRGTAGPFGGPTMAGGSERDFAIPQSGCGIPPTAQAYSLNVTVVPKGYLGYLTLWPTGQPQASVSTLNSWEGIVVANAAIVPAGATGAVSVYVANPADLILDINGYFDTSTGSNSYAFYPATPCRMADTRGPTGQFGGPSMDNTETRDFPIPLGNCAIPATARGYSLNFTVVPSGYLGFLTTWPTGQAQPNVSTLNSWTGKVVANAALVPAGSNESISVYVSNPTHVILDINGYFGQPGSGGALSFYPVPPCRVADTRGAVGMFGGPEMGATTTRAFAIPASGCNIPSTAAAYSLNVTVVPDGYLGYLSAWPAGSAQPGVSTLNSWDGAVVANAAIVPAGTGGAIDVYVTNQTQVIIDINGYFAP